MLPRITSILTSRFLINLQEVKQKLAGASQSFSEELEFQQSTSRNPGGFLESFEGHISFDGGNFGDDEEEAVEVLVESVAETVEVVQG